MSVNANASAGYSGKPLWQKLGLAPGQRLRIVDAPSDYAGLTGFDVALAVPVQRGAFDFGHAFVRTRRELDAVLAKLDPLLAPAGQLWISWPKKASKVPTDITEDSVRDAALPLGLVDVKVCAVDAVWSGLKLVRRKALR